MGQINDKQLALYIMAPAAAAAYFDPLSGYIPYSQPISAALAADVWYAFARDKTGSYDKGMIYGPGMLGASVGCLAATYLFPGLDSRVVGAMGAAGGVLGAGMVTLGDNFNFLKVW